MRNQTRITICTIVRNRAYLLPHVYETLLAQTRFHFEWLIIDQERQGQLRMLTSGWRGRTEPFVIRVAKCQENGRMQAVQMALDVARGGVFLSVGGRGVSGAGSDGMYSGLAGQDPGR